MEKKLFLLVCAAAVLCLAGPAHASETYAYAAISGSANSADGSFGHGTANNSDHDSQLFSCVSSITVTCPDASCAASARTDSSVIYNFGAGPGNIVTTTSGKATNNEPTQYNGHRFTNSGWAKAFTLNARLVGAGLTANAKLLLDNLCITRSNTGLTSDVSTATMNLDVAAVNVYTGGFNLYGDGSYSGTGIYADSHFTVSLDSGTNTWVAKYTDTAATALDVSLPVGSDFELELYSDIDSTSAYGAPVSTHDLAISIPQGYDFTPEPASCLLLALGSMAVLRKRRAK